MKTKLFIGIDPGKKGGFAAINDEGEVVSVMATPVSGKEIDIDRIATWITDFVIEARAKGYGIISSIEKISAMPGQGVSSMFAMGFNNGVVHGMLATYRIPRYLVTPHKWKSLVLDGTTRDKVAAIDYCRRVYPYVDLRATPRSRSNSDGIADAICIAEYIYKVMRNDSDIR